MKDWGRLSVREGMPLVIIDESGKIAAKPLAHGELSVDEYRERAYRIVACFNACIGIETRYLQQGAVPVDIESLLEECAKLIALSDSPARKGLFCDIRRAVVKLKSARGEVVA